MATMATKLATKRYKTVGGFLRGEYAYTQGKAARDGRPFSVVDAERDVVNSLLAQLGGIANRVGVDEVPAHIVLRLYHQTSRLDEDRKRALAHAMRWLATPHELRRGFQ
jgi:hypothetical protein